VMPPMDPRSIMASPLLMDNTSAIQAGTFARSATWLNLTKTWVNPPMVTTLPTASTTSHVVAANPYDFQAVIDAQTWNTTHAMSLPTNGMPVAVQKIMYLRADPRFINTFYVDFTGAATSTDIQLSMRDNSVTSGNYQNAAAGTVPVFTFPNTSTYGGTGRSFQVTLLQSGRFNVGFRIVDNAANWSMFEMEWIVL